MRFEYYPETDTSYLNLADEPSVETWEILPNVNADFGAAGALVGIEIDPVAPVNRMANAVQATRIVDDSVTAAARSATYAYLAGRRQGKTHDEARRDAIAAVLPASIDAAGELLHSEKPEAPASETV